MNVKLACEAYLKKTNKKTNNYTFYIETDRYHKCNMYMYKTVISMNTTTFSYINVIKICIHRQKNLYENSFIYIHLYGGLLPLVFDLPA